jgi:hypothetical protein
MAGRPLPTEQEVRAWIRERRNRGRWGKDDQGGAGEPGGVDGGGLRN